MLLNASSVWKLRVIDVNWAVQKAGVSSWRPRYKEQHFVVKWIVIFRFNNKAGARSGDSQSIYWGHLTCQNKVRLFGFSAPADRFPHLLHFWVSDIAYRSFTHSTGYINAIPGHKTGPFVLFIMFSSGEWDLLTRMQWQKSGSERLAFDGFYWVCKFQAVNCFWLEVVIFCLWRKVQFSAQHLQSWQKNVLEFSWKCTSF